MYFCYEIYTTWFRPEDDSQNVLDQWSSPMITHENYLESFEKLYGARAHPRNSYGDSAMSLQLRITGLGVQISYILVL